MGKFDKTVVINPLSEIRNKLKNIRSHVHVRTISFGSNDHSDIYRQIEELTIIIDKLVQTIDEQ